jgi:oligosaccharyltransferase complex subunit gamma
LLGRADFSQAREAFAKMKLESAPVVMHFPPTEGALAGADASIDRYQIQFDPEHFAGWVSQSTQIPVRWVKPINYEQLVFNLTVLLLVLAVGKLVYSNFSGRFLQNPHIWAVVTLVFIIHMNSGYMWNQIRHAPYSGQTRQGKIELISGNFQSQYVIETQIITVLYAGCAAAFIWLVQRVPKFESENAQRYALYVGMAMFVGLYSLLINVFRIKNGGYPFRLLL